MKVVPMADNSQIQDAFYTLGNIAAKAEVPAPIVENAFYNFWEFCDSINSIPPKTVRAYGAEVNLMAFTFLVDSAWRDGFLFTENGAVLSEFLSAFRNDIVSGKVRTWAAKQKETPSFRKIQTLIDSAGSTMLSVIFGADYRIPIHVVDVSDRFEQEVYGGTWKQTAWFCIVTGSDRKQIVCRWSPTLETCVGKTIILALSQSFSETGKQFYKLGSAGSKNLGFANVVLAARGIAGNNPVESDIGQRSTRRWSPVIPDGEMRDQNREKVDILDFIEEAFKADYISKNQWVAVECMRVSDSKLGSACSLYNEKMGKNVSDRHFRYLFDSARGKMKLWRDSLSLD